MITVLGSINLDLIGKLHHIPRPGETVPGSSFSSAPGGKGANQALAARRAGANVSLYGAVGRDAYAEQALALLDRDGVDLGTVRHVDASTGIAMIFVDEKGENVIGILPGANGMLTSHDAEVALEAMAPGDVLIVQQEVATEATRKALQLANGRGVTSILNTAPFLPGTGELSRHASIVVANETEFEELSGAPPSEASVRDWANSRGQRVIVTRGGAGAWGAARNVFWSVDALKITPVDTVGAGDTFVGYLAAAIDAKLDLEAAMRRAAVAASLACLKEGAQPAIPYAGEVDEALNNGSM